MVHESPPGNRSLLGTVRSGERIRKDSTNPPGKHCTVMAKRVQFDLSKTQLRTDFLCPEQYQ